MVHNKGLCLDGRQVGSNVNWLTSLPSSRLTFWSRRRPCGARPGFGLGTNARKIPSGCNGLYWSAAGKATEIPDYLSGIDLRNFPGLLSDTFMSGATTKLPVPVPAQTSRRLAIGRMIATALLLAGCCGNLYAGQAKPKMHDNRHEIEQLEEAWRNAVLKSDIAAMSALLSDDYIAITASGTLQTKDDALANLGRRHVITLDISDRKVRFYGKTALVTSLANVETTTAEGDTSGSFRYTRVYVRNRQGKWEIVSFEASRIRQPGERRKHDSVTNTK